MEGVDAAAVSAQLDLAEIMGQQQPHLRQLARFKLVERLKRFVHGFPAGTIVEAKAELGHGGRCRSMLAITAF